jgi:hypothetical protein
MQTHFPTRESRTRCVVAQQTTAKLVLDLETREQEQKGEPQQAHDLVGASIETQHST